MYLIDTNQQGTFPPSSLSPKLLRVTFANQVPSERTCWKLKNALVEMEDQGWEGIVGK